MGVGHLPTNTISVCTVFGNGLWWKSPVESTIGMWQMGGKRYLRWWEAKTLGLHDGKGFGPPTANTKCMCWT